MEEFSNQTQVEEKAERKSSKQETTTSINIIANSLGL